MYNADLSWFRDEAYWAFWDGFSVPQPAILERKFNLIQLVQSVRDLDGDTAECGSYIGEGSYIILKGMEQSTSEKLHHIFDSFEGLSEPTDVDDVDNQAVYKWQKHDLSVSENTVNKNLQDFPNKRLYKGWIPDRFDEVSGRRFCFVHIDVDLYEPTRDSVSFFYDKVTPGGMIVCDDYGFTTCPGARKALDEFMADKPESIIHLTTGQGVIIKR